MTSRLFQFFLNISSSYVGVKLHTENQPSNLEEDINQILIFFSIFLLVMLESSYIQKISLLACIILEIAVKKTLKLRFVRRPQIF